VFATGVAGAVLFGVLASESSSSATGMSRSSENSTTSPRTARDKDVQCIRLPQRGANRGWTTAVYEVQNCLKPDAADRARDAVNEAFDAGATLLSPVSHGNAGRTTDRGVSLPTQDVMVSSLPQRTQDEIKEALEIVRLLSVDSV